MRIGLTWMVAAASLAASGAHAQKLGVGGTMIGNNGVVETCPVPLGTVSLVEEKRSAVPEANLPPQLAAFMAMARAQQGGAAVDPLPLLKLLAAQSGCFKIVDRGAAFNAIQAERQIAAAGQTAGPAPTATLTASDFVLVAQMVYQDNNAGGMGGLGGGLFGGGGGFKQIKKEAQALLTLNRVSTGVQEAAASGQARKKDVGLVLGGLLGAGIGAIGGGYESTDIGKVTAAALLDGFNKLMKEMKAKSLPAATPTVPAAVSMTAEAVAAPTPATASAPR